MKPDKTLRSRVQYGRALVNSGLSGLRSGRDSHLHGQPLSDVLTESARGALGLAVIGTCVAVVGSYFTGQRARSLRAVGYGAVGSAIGFVIGFTWKTRELSASMGRSALKEMGVVRDEHWLESHPIDYA
jgi:hypothetical protein